LLYYFFVQQIEVSEGGIIMLEVVKVSTIDKEQSLIASIEGYFKRGHYDEITQAIGMYSTVIDPQHMIADQSRFYRFVLNLLKGEVSKKLGKQYAAWYTDFPRVIDGIVTAGKENGNSAFLPMLASHREAYGPFKSLDDFFLWALDDRKMTLSQLVQFIEQTIAARC